jgi:hypothetical protein
VFGGEHSSVTQEPEETPAPTEPTPAVVVEPAAEPEHAKPDELWADEDDDFDDPDGDGFDLWDLMAEEGVAAPEEHEAELLHPDWSAEPSERPQGQAELVGEEEEPAEEPAEEPGTEQETEADDMARRMQERLKERAAQEGAEREARVAAEEAQLAEELRLASFAYGYEVPQHAVLPRELDEKARYRLWVKDGDAWTRVDEPEGVFRHKGGMFRGAWVRPVWDRTLEAYEGQSPVFMPSDRVPASEALGALIKIGEHEVSPDRPPNFLGLIPEKLVRRRLVTVEDEDGKPVRDEDGRLVQKEGALAGAGASRRYRDYYSGNFVWAHDNIQSQDCTDTWLIESGFYDAVQGPATGTDRQGEPISLSDQQRDRRLAVLHSNVQGIDWLKLREQKHVKIWEKTQRDLTAWWTNITNEQREHFWTNYCHRDKQNTLAKTADPRHELAEFAVPKGMEKMSALRGPYWREDATTWADAEHTIPWHDRDPDNPKHGKPWDFHVYQKKAANFVVDHAPRSILAMEMGLGKTLTALGAFHELKQRGEIDQMIVSAPVSAMGSWEEHFGDLSDARVGIANGSKKQKERVVQQFERGELDVLVVTTDAIAIDMKKAKELDEVPKGANKVTLKMKGSYRGATWETSFLHRRTDGEGFSIFPDTRKLAGWDDMRISLGNPLGYQKHAHDEERRRQSGGKSYSNAMAEARRAILEEAPEGATMQTYDGYLRKMADGTWAAPREDRGGWKAGRRTSDSICGRGDLTVCSARHLSGEVKRIQLDAGDVKLAYENPESNKARLQAMMEAKGKRTLRVADELHKFKNPNSNRARGFFDVFTEPEGRVIGMTGTPKPNGVQDFYTIMDHVAPGSLGDTYADFSERYSYRYRAFGADKVAGLRPEQLPKLYEDSAHVMFVRTTNDPDSKIILPKRRDLSPSIPLSDFQEKVTTAFGEWVAVKRVIQILGNRENPGPEYEAAVEKLAAAERGDMGSVAQVAASGAHTDAQVMLMRAQQLAISPSLLSPAWGEANPGYESPKTKLVADSFQEHMSQQPSTGGVIFCTFNDGIAEMQRALVRRGFREDQIAVYKGGVTPKKRAEIQKKLNSGELKVVLGNSASLQTGANMQKRANFVAHLSTPWAPDALTQSTARVYRQGQQNVTTILRPVGSDAEALVERVVSRKLMEAGQATGKTMAADKAVAETVRGAKLDAASIAKVLGIDPANFGSEELTDALREELGMELPEED